MGHGRSCSLKGDTLIPNISHVAISKRGIRGTVTPKPSSGSGSSLRPAAMQAYSAKMVGDAIFHMFPKPQEERQLQVSVRRENAREEDDRFIQKEYPMLYMNLRAHKHPFVLVVQYLNMHLVHSIKGRDLIGVMQNLSVDLMGKSYLLANEASLCIMNHVQTHLGRVIFVPDQEMAKIHNDSVKQFIGLAATYQSLMKHKHEDDDKAPPRGTSPITLFAFMSAVVFALERGVVCRSDPQCAAVVLLKNTLYASPENRCWPSSEELLILRNSPYACVLAYMGLGDIESIGRCYERLGRLVFLLRRQQVLHMQHSTACPWHN
ncbi:hypothetical protein XENOCAPTIV_024311 [Xenoophorus captivus]|uniref:Uncharacterized protein n=1 Tax=Xenoophorus captivus TaxID=1517983 RepID=A0ABV0RS80_9TELE